MATERLCMRTNREILRQKWTVGLQPPRGGAQPSARAGHHQQRYPPRSGRRAGLGAGLKSLIVNAPLFSSSRIRTATSRGCWGTSRSPISREMPAAGRCAAGRQDLLQWPLVGVSRTTRSDQGEIAVRGAPPREPDGAPRRGTGGPHRPPRAASSTRMRAAITRAPLRALFDRTHRSRAPSGKTPSCS